MVVGGSQNHQNHQSVYNVDWKNVWSKRVLKVAEIPNSLVLTAILQVGHAELDVQHVLLLPLTGSMDAIMYKYIYICDFKHKKQPRTNTNRAP